MASACDTRKSGRNVKDAPLKWNTTEARRVCASMTCMLEALEEYDQFVRLCCHEKATEASQVAIGIEYLCEFNLLPFDKSDKREFIKSSKISTEFRNAGNEHFVKNNKEALILYSKSIAAAPYPTSDKEPSEELALAFANRSAVYFLLKNNDACLKDIEQALVFNYPDKMKYKLLERRAKCYLNLGKKEEARASAQDAVKNLSAATHLADNKMKSTIDALNKLQVHVDECEPSESSAALKALPQKAYGQHKKIPSASKCVDINYKPNGGRHIVANRDIDPGDVLFVEEPFASLLEPHAHFTHCNNCTKRSDAMIPCEKCDQVMYCSQTCRDVSWASCHHIECRIIPELRRLDVGDSSMLLALRMLLVACSQNSGIVGLLNLEKELTTQKTDNSVKGFDKNGNYLSSDYYQIHHLFRNIRKEPNLVTNWVVTAACILNCLEAHSDIFSLEVSDSISMSNIVLSTGGLILKYLHMISTNAYSVTEFVLKADIPNHIDVPIACAVYSTMSLLNHSCDPTACKSFHNGSVGVVIARQPIRKGQEVSMSYENYYGYSDIVTRRKSLSYKYCFECQCIACTNNWPLFEGLESLVDPTFICSKCRVALPHKPPRGQHQWVACKVCKKKYDVWLLFKQTIMIRERVTYIYDMRNSVNCPDYTSELASIVKNLDTILLYPNQLMDNCQEHLRFSMKISGNHVIA